MKIIFASFVAVIFWENLVITNANCKANSMGEHIWAKRQITNITTYMDVDAGVRALQYNNATLNMDMDEDAPDKEIVVRSSIKRNTYKFIKNIKRIARIKTAHINKIARRAKSQMMLATKRHKKDFSKYPKMSGAELDDLKGKMMKAMIITSKGAESFLDLVKKGVDSLRELFERAGEDAKEMAEACVDNLDKYYDECEAKVKHSHSKVTARQCACQLTNIAIVSNDKLKAFYESSKSHILQVERSSMQSVLEVSTTIKENYQSLTSSNEGLNSYIRSMLIKVDSVTQTAADKFKEMLDNCLLVVYQLVVKGGELIEELAKLQGYLAIAIACCDDGAIKKWTLIIQQTKDKFDKSNKRMFEELLQELDRRSKDIWNSMQREIAEMKTCSPTGGGCK